jgi:parallel beta-helix repeat protein
MISKLAVLILAIAAVPAIAQQKAFVHPGMLQSRQDLEFMKAKVAAGEEPWKKAWNNLLAQPYSSLSFQAKPVTHIARGSFGRASTGDRDLSASANAAYSHALQWYVTGEKAHARKAIEVIQAWSAVLWDFEGNDAKLLAGWTGGTFCNAAEILRSTDSGWADADSRQFKRMLLTVYYPLLMNFFPEANGNWDAAIIDTLLSIGIFCDDRVIFDRAVDHFLRGPGNGGITKYVYPSGQCDENARDQGHAQLGLGYFARAARVAWNQGVDLWGAADNRLALGFEYTAKYMLGEDPPSYGVISPVGRGRLGDIYESVYQHYHFTKGLEMPYTGRAIERTRPSGWTALTLHRGPVPASPRSAPPPAPAMQAADAGALAQATAPPPADAVTVAPGQSVQEAVDARAGGGGWVVLAKGLHVIHAALRLPSGITLAGQGRDSVVFLDPKAAAENAGIAIVNAAPDLHDVTLRDFVVEGSTLSRPPTDPNQDHRARSYQNAPSRGGILFAAERAGQMRNLRFEHLTVRNCTHTGVAIRGAAQVAIVASDFSDNGGSVVPGPGLEHDLVLAHVEGAEVRGSRFDDSAWGSGIDVTFSRDITIFNNEMARNSLYGIRVSESENVRVRGNLAEGDDAGGIRFDTLLEGSRNIVVRDNLLRNNGGPGLQIAGAAGADVHMNSEADNGSSPR